MKIDKKEFFYLSNILSLSRLVLMIPILYLLRFQTQWANIAVLVLAILAAATDFLDGYVSRKKNQVTDLGKIIDPLADKICLGVGLIVLVIYRNFPIPLVIFLIYRDLMIILMGWLIFKKLGHPTASNFWGKANTTVIAITGILAFVRLPYPYLSFFILMSYGTILVSGIVYARLGQRILCTSLRSKILYWGVLILTTAIVVFWTLNFKFI